MSAVWQSKIAIFENQGSRSRDEEALYSQSCFFSYYAISDVPTEMEILVALILYDCLVSIR